MLRHVLLIALLTLAAGSAALAQDNPKVPPPQAPAEQGALSKPPRGSIGPSGQVTIGDLAPDFELDGSRGEPVKLSRLRGDWVLLVFNERRDDFLPMRSIEAEMRESGVRIVGVCHEKARTLDNYPGRDSAPLMLADALGDVSQMYGLFDNSRHATVPGFLVLDRDGIVRIAFFGRLLPPEEIGRLTQFAVTGS